MALQRTRKTVIFHDGMSDGTDRYLLEPPSTDYIENLHFTKDGSLQKRMGFGPDPLTTVDSPTGDVIAFHSIGDEIYVLTTKGFHVYSDGAWSLADIPGFLGTDAVAAETPQFPGMGHFDAALYTAGTTDVYVVVFEVRERAAGDPSVSPQEKTPKHIIVQSYSNDGRFIGQQRIDSAQSPKIVVNDAQVFVIFWQDILTDTLRARLYVPWNAKWLGTEQNSTIVVNPLYGMEAHSSRLSQIDGTITWIDRSMRHTRLGASTDGFARYHVIYNETEGRYYVLYQVAESVKLARLTTNFTFTPVQTITLHDAQAVLFDPGSGDQPRFSGEAFAIEAVLGRVAVMWGKYRKGKPGGAPGDNSQTEVWVGVYEAADLAEVWKTTVRQDDGLQDWYTGAVYTHGSLLYDGFLGLQWFVHCSGPSPCRSQDLINYDVDMDAVRDFWREDLLADKPGAGLFFGSLIVTVGDVAKAGTQVLSQRLAGKPFRFKSQTYAPLQQWTDLTPYSPDVGTCETWTNTLPISTPRTTVLSVFDYTARTVRPVAALDPGQSLFSQYTESELITHLPNVVVDGDDIILINRVQIQAEDCSLHMGGTVPTGYNRLGYSEAPSDALLRVHRITDSVNPEDVPVCSLGDGLFIGAAIPLWYDGRSIVEMSPLSQPEIVSVTDEAIYTVLDRLPTQAFDDKFRNINPANNPWRKMAVVVGYYDSSGNKHRSAPSNTLYVADIFRQGLGFPDTWRGKEVSVRFSTVLSLLDDNREYFVEVYASDTADSDMLLVSTGSVPLGSMEFVGDFTTSFQLIRAILSIEAGNNTDFSDPPRASEPLYTAGGVLAADPWPSFKVAVATSTRIWALDAVNTGRVIPSKLFEDYIAPEYNASLAINLGDERELTAIGKLDDKVVVFEANDIHVIYGDGPDNRGQGNDFAVHYISTDVGCVDQESIIETPVGLIFYHAPRGFYILDRNLQVQFIGGGVEDIGRGIDIVSATLVSEEAEVRFVFTGGPAFNDDYVPGQGSYVIVGPPTPKLQNVPPLIRGNAFVYNYERKQWALFNNYSSMAATMYQDRYTLLKNDWSIWQESADRYDDPSGYNTTDLITPWIKLSEAIQDFTRVWQIKVIGRYLSSLQDMGGGALEAGDVRVEVFYDYEVVATDRKVYRVQEFDYDAFNSPVKRTERFQFTIEPSRGRCQAIKLRFYETNSSDQGEGLTYAQGRGFEITAVDFDLGVSPMRPLLQAGARR